MPIIDSHVHIVSSQLGQYPPNESGRAMADRFHLAPVSAEDLRSLMRSAAVDAAVFVQYFGVYGYDNRYLLDASEAHRDVATSVCVIDVMAPDAVDTLTELVRVRGVRGLRLFQSPSEPEVPWLHDARGERVWDCARELAIPIVVGRTPPVPAHPQAPAPQHLDRLRELLGRYSDVPVAMDNLAVIGTPPDVASLSGELLSLAEFPNVFCKLSTVNFDRCSREGVPSDKFLGPLFERFGVGRVMWGSNYPATNDRPYAELVETARSGLRFLDDAGRAAVLGGTALRLWPELASGADEHERTSAGRGESEHRAP